MTGRRSLKRWALALLACVAVSSPLVLTHTDYDFVLLSMIVIAGTLALGLVADALAASPPASWSTPSHAALTVDREDPGLVSYRRLLEGHYSTKVVDSHLQMRIRQLADQRLMHTFSIRFHDDPERAATILGLDLAAMVNGPPARLSPAQLSRLLSRIEEL